LVELERELTRPHSRLPLGPGRGSAPLSRRCQRPARRSQTLNASRRPPGRTLCLREPNLYNLYGMPRSQLPAAAGEGGKRLRAGRHLGGQQGSDGVEEVRACATRGGFPIFASRLPSPRAASAFATPRTKPQTPDKKKTEPFGPVPL